MPPTNPPRPARPPVSRERYMVRRVGAGAVALVVLLLAGFVLVQLVGALGGSEDDAGAISATDASVGTAAVITAGADGTDGVAGGSGGPPSTTAAPTTAESTVPPSSAAATTTAPPVATTAVATTAPPGGGAAVPTAAAPAKVLVVGDSDAGTFGPYLKQLVDATGVATTSVDYKVSSGLARPDFYDWPAHLAETLPTEAPDIIVVTFGGNDAQGLSTVDGTNPEEWNDPVAKTATWTAEYSARAGAMMDQLAEGGRTVIWVGIPNDDSDDVTARLEVQDAAVEAALASRPHVQFVDTWALFSSPNGGWAEYAVDPRDGQGKDVRAEDGFHLNENGAEILAVKIADLVTADLRSRGATL